MIKKGKKKKKFMHASHIICINNWDLSFQSFVSFFFLFHRIEENSILIKTITIQLRLNHLIIFPLFLFFLMVNSHRHSNMEMDTTQNGHHNNKILKKQDTKIQVHDKIVCGHTHQNTIVIRKYFIRSRKKEKR